MGVVSLIWNVAVFAFIGNTIDAENEMLYC